MLSRSKKRLNKRKCSECSGECCMKCSGKAVDMDMDMECTPTEFIQRCSPGSKHKRRFIKGKENGDDDGGHFVLARRSRRKKESSPGKEVTPSLH